MRWTRRAAVVLAFAAAVGPAASRVQAAGNGSVPGPTGTIYFQDLSTFDPSTNTITLFSMDGEGADVTQVLRADRCVRPSRILHGFVDPARWFLTMKSVEGQEIGGSPRRDVFAVRADGAEVRVTSDSAMEYWMPEWAFGEDQEIGVVSMLGRRWTSDAPDATVVPSTAGMYFSDLVFDGRDVVAARGSSFVTGVSSGPHPVLGMRLVDVPDDRSDDHWNTGGPTTGGPSPDVASYSWSSVFLAIQDLDASTPHIRETQLAAGSDEMTYFIRRGEGQDPDCREAHIAYRRLVAAGVEGQGTDSWTIKTSDAGIGSFNDLGGLTQTSVPFPETANATQIVSNPKVSPDGNYVAYQCQRKVRDASTYSIHRVTGGLGPKNLTPRVKPAAAGASGMVLVAWR